MGGTQGRRDAKVALETAGVGERRGANVALERTGVGRKGAGTQSHCRRTSPRCSEWVERSGRRDAKVALTRAGVGGTEGRRGAKIVLAEAGVGCSWVWGVQAVRGRVV